MLCPARFRVEFAVFGANDRKAAAADIARSGMGNGHREGSRDRRVDGVTTGGENVVTDVTGQRGLRDDHRGRAAALQRRIDRCGSDVGIGGAPRFDGSRRR